MVKHGIVTVNQQPVGAHPAVPGASSGSGHSLQGPEPATMRPDRGWRQAPAEPTRWGRAGSPWPSGLEDGSVHDGDGWFSALAGAG